MRKALKNMNERQVFNKWHMMVRFDARCTIEGTTSWRAKTTTVMPASRIVNAPESNRARQPAADFRVRSAAHARRHDWTQASRSLSLSLSLALSLSLSLSPLSLALARPTAAGWQPLGKIGVF